MKTTIILSLAACFLFIAGCEVDPPVSNVQSLGGFHQKYSPATQTFSFNGETGGTMVTAAGVEIVIPDSTFRDYYGNLISGALTLEVKEFFKKSDMVLGGMHTMAWDGLLESAGMFYIELKKDGHKIYPYEDRITINIPANSINTSMQLFSAQPGTNPFMPSYGYSPTVDGWSLIYPDSLTGQGGYIDYDAIPPMKYILTTGLGFINCDRFINDTNTTRIMVKVAEPFDLFNIAVYVAFNDINSIGYMQHNYADTTLPLVYTSQDIPISQPVTVIVLGVKDNAEYLGIKDIIVSDNQEVDIDVKESTEAKILDAMERLNE